MSDDKKCFYKDVEVRFYDCDSKNTARIESILRIMADFAGIAFAAKGYSHKWLWEHQSVFLITKAAIRIHRAPICDETVHVETWEVGMKGVQFYRDFIFYDQSGNPIVEGKTAWVVVNPETREILKPSEVPAKFDPYPEKAANTLPLTRLKSDTVLETKGHRKIVYSDIDKNRHTYNAAYAAISCDFLPYEIMSRKLKDVRIYFKQEALLGETLQIKNAVEKNCAYTEGYLGNRLSYQCEMLFE